MSIPLGPTFFYANGMPFTGNMQVFYNNDCRPLDGNVVVDETPTITSNPG